MRLPIYRSHRRRIVRRAVRTDCEAVAIKGFRLISTRVIDMSPHGLLVACDGGAQVGEEVVISFRAPASNQWFDAVSRVARVVEGYRPTDPGYCAGLRFERISLEARLDLAERLRGLPPPVPKRGLRPEYFPRWLGPSAVTSVAT